MKGGEHPSKAVGFPYIAATSVITNICVPIGGATVSCTTQLIGQKEGDASHRILLVTALVAYPKNYPIFNYFNQTPQKMKIAAKFIIPQNIYIVCW